MSRYLIPLLLLFCGLAPSGFAQAHFPLPDDATDFKVAQEISEFETLYSYKTRKTISELFDFYKAQLLRKGWTATNRSEQEMGGAPVGQMSFFHKEDSRSITLIAQYDSYPNGDLVVAVDLVTDLKGAIAFHEGKRKEVKSKEMVPSTVSLSFEKELDAIRDAINSRNFEALIHLSSPWFRSHYSKEFLKKQLENLYVKELVPLFASEGDELGFVVVKFECRDGPANELGYRVMYFDRIDESWRFNGLPFNFMDIQLPRCMTRKFLEDEKEPNQLAEPPATSGRGSS
jgi:hypothetical protein